MAAFDAALAALRHHPSFQSRLITGDGHQGAAAVFRPDDPPEIHEERERGLVVGVLGAVLEYRGSWRRFRARELAALYAARGLAAVGGLDGAYLVLIWDRCEGVVQLLNDRIGSLPVHHARVGDAVAFAPEAKALFRLLPLTPRLDFTGAVSFLNLGYAVGTHTLFEGVRLVPPAHALTIDTRTGSTRVTPVWKQSFQPERGLGLGGATRMLYEAMLAAHQAPLGPPGEPTRLALTGGYDSRAVLGMLQAVGSPPVETLTWGATDRVPGSDVTVARELARLAGVSHRFLDYGSNDVARNARDWCVISELATDNLGFFAAGAGFLGRAGISGGAIYLGEHVVGAGGLPRTVDEAVETVTRLPARGLVPTVAGVLTTDGRERGREVIWRELGTEVSACTSHRPKDIQDHLFLRVDAFRWLFAPAFYKEPMMSVRRPLFLGPVFEVIARLPEALRVDKRVLVEVMNRRLLSLMTPPLTRGNSLPDWTYDSRQTGGFGEFLRERTRPEALAGLPLTSLLDLDAVRGVVDAFFREHPRPADRRGEAVRFWVTARRRFMGLPGVGAVFGLVQPALRRWQSPRARGALRPFKLVIRLALLQLMQTSIEAGDFGGARDRRGDGAGGAPPQPG